MSERQQHFAYLPAHDGHGAATFGLSENGQASFTHGAQQAQAWLDDSSSGWLWTGCCWSARSYRPVRSAMPSSWAFSAVFTNACARPWVVGTWPGERSCSFEPASGGLR